MKRGRETEKRKQQNRGKEGGRDRRRDREKRK